MLKNFGSIALWSTLGFRSVALVVATAGANLFAVHFVPNLATLAASFVLMQNLLSLVANANALYYSNGKLDELHASYVTLAALYMTVAVGYVFDLFRLADMVICLLSVTQMYFLRQLIWKVELQSLTKYCFIDGASLILSTCIFSICLTLAPTYAICAGMVLRVAVWYAGIGRNAKVTPVKIKVSRNLEPFVVAQVLSVAVSISSVVWASKQPVSSAAGFVGFITMLSLGPLAFNYASRFLNRLDYIGKTAFVKREIALIVALSVYAVAIGAKFTSVLPTAVVGFLAVATIFQTSVAFVERRLWRKNGRIMLGITAISFALSIVTTRLGYGFVAPVEFSVLVFSYFLICQSWRNEK